MAIFGLLPTVRTQTASHPGVQTALDYVDKVSRADSPERARLFALGAGESVKVELGDGVIAIDAAYMSRSRPEVFFETHRKYIDVQVLFAGEEAMEIADRAALSVAVPYDDEKDFVKYADYGTPSVLRVQDGVVAVFFPVDGHMAHAVSAPVLVRKTVVKVPAAGA